MSSFESWRFKRFAPLLKFSKELSAFSTSFENVSSRQIQVFFPGYPHLFLKRIPEGSVCCLMDDAQFSKAGHDVHPAYAQINLLQRKPVEIWQPGFHKCIKHIIIYCIPGLFFFCFQSWDCLIAVLGLFMQVFPKECLLERGIRAKISSLSYTFLEPALKRAGKGKSCPVGIPIFLVN